MSGGSYNYLCYADPDDLFDRESDLQAMSDRLAKLGYAHDAAKETEELILAVRQARIRLGVRLTHLSPIFRAVEWWDSGDYGERQLKEELEKWRASLP